MEDQSNQSTNSNSNNTTVVNNSETNSNINNQQPAINPFISVLRSISLDETRDKLIDIFEKKLVETINGIIEETKVELNTNNSNSNANMNANNNTPSIFSAINTILNDTIKVGIVPKCGDSKCSIAKCGAKCETKCMLPKNNMSDVVCSDGVCLLNSNAGNNKNDINNTTEKTFQKEYETIVSKDDLISQNVKIYKKIDKIQKQIQTLSNKMNRLAKKMSENCKLLNEISHSESDSDSDLDSDSDY